MESVLLLGLFLFLNAEMSWQAIITDCGKPDKIVSFESIRIEPDPVQYPGFVSLSSVFNVASDLPASGMRMDMSFIKTEPVLFPVPCFQGIGSCKHDACTLIQRFPDYVCPHFPPGVECGCPVKAGRYVVDNAGLVIPDYGKPVGRALQGRYNGNVTLVDTSNFKELGCMNVDFRIVSTL